MEKIVSVQNNSFEVLCEAGGQEIVSERALKLETSILYMYATIKFCICTLQYKLLLCLIKEKEIKALQAHDV
jgi:hypothetical protein